MGEFVVMKVANFWAVTTGEVIFSRSASASEAIRRAVETAAAIAARGKEVHVLFDDPDGGTRVLWDSKRDGFSKG
jgi:hypothetical protein